MPNLTIRIKVDDDDDDDDDEDDEGGNEEQRDLAHMAPHCGSRITNLFFKIAVSTIIAYRRGGAFVIWLLGVRRNHGIPRNSQDKRVWTVLLHKKNSGSAVKRMLILAAQHSGTTNCKGAGMDQRLDARTHYSQHC